MTFGCQMLSAPSRFELANIIHKARLASGSALFLKFSAPPQRSLRLGGEIFSINIHPRDAEVAEVAQRNPN